MANNAPEKVFRIGFINASVFKNVIEPKEEGKGQKKTIVYFRGGDDAEQNQADAQWVSDTYYDGAIVKDNQRGRPLPASQWASVTVPALVMDGGKSPVWMRHGMQALAAALPNAQYRTLEGQTHNVKAKAHAPALVEFFKG